MTEKNRTFPYGIEPQKYQVSTLYTCRITSLTLHVDKLLQNNNPSFPYEIWAAGMPGEKPCIHARITSLTLQPVAFSNLERRLKQSFAIFAS